MAFKDDAGDRQIIEGCIAGDRQSWNLFVERFSKLIYWSIHEALKDSSFGTRKDLPEDIFQDVFSRLFEKEQLSKLRDLQSIRRYLNVMACHATLDKIKSLRRLELKSAPIESADWGGAVVDVASDAQTNETAVLVETALNQLNPKEKACIELHFLNDRTHKEIGEILGIPQDTVSTVIRRSKDKIKIELEKRGFEI